jgi:ribulose 1,5-bisphosphate synthetase/thiazole synthase
MMRHGEVEEMSKRKIVIIGAGIAGLTVAYALHKNGQFDFKVIVSKDAEDIRNGRILSTQAHFEALLQTETRFGIPDYGAVNEIKKIELLMNGQKLFKGNLKCRAVSQDQRVYLSTLMDGLRDRGIEIQKTRLTQGDMSRLAAESDLIIDCTGKMGPIANFPVYQELANAPQSPLRAITAGMFHGLTPAESNIMSYNIAPGLGELFETTTVTKQGLAGSLLLEAIPGSELDCMKGIKGPEDFVKKLLRMLQAYFPHIHERINVDEFRLVDPVSYVQMAIQPEIRIPYTMVNGTLVVGCGDSVVLNDPITGQGANAASYCANVLYSLISEHADEAWDDAFGEQYWMQSKEYVTKMSEWTNAMMGPPSESFSALLGKASHNQETADELVTLFANPIAAHSVFFASHGLSV